MVNGLPQLLEPNHYLYFTTLESCFLNCSEVRNTEILCSVFSDTFIYPVHTQMLFISFVCLSQVAHGRYLYYSWHSSTFAENTWLFARASAEDQLLKPYGYTLELYVRGIIDCGKGFKEKYPQHSPWLETHRMVTFFSDYISEYYSIHYISGVCCRSQTFYKIKQKKSHWLYSEAANKDLLQPVRSFVYYFKFYLETLYAIYT